MPAASVSSPSGDADDYITPAEVARLLRMSARTLEKWRRDGYGPAHHKRGRNVLYRRIDIRTWMTERRALSTTG